MRYASLDEAYINYSDTYQKGGMYDDDKLLSNDSPELANNQESMAPGLRNGSLSNIQSRDVIDTGTQLVSDVITRLDDVASRQVPINSSNVVSPDKEIQKGGQYYQRMYKGGSDECMQHLDHVLNCNDCMTKLNKMINGKKNNNTFSTSQIIYWLILALILISIVDIINKLYNKISK